MISEEKENLVIERLIQRNQQANTYFLKKIGEVIRQIRDIRPTEAHQLEQLLKYGGNYDEIINELTRYTKMNVADIEKIFDNYAKADYQFAKKFYNYRGAPYISFDENFALNEQTQVLTNIAQNEMYNFSRTNVLGYTINNADGIPQFYGLRETYNRVVDEAFLNVSQGKETFDSAMSKVMSDIGGSGLKTLNYESGRAIRLDSAVRMHMKSRLRELHNETQMIIGEQIDANGVEISVHSNPADDHAEVQGRQFSINQYDENGNLIKEGEWEKLQRGEVAKDYTGKLVQLGHSKRGGYRPISELNCYHYVFSVVLGVSEKEYDNDELQEIIDNTNEKFEFDGKKYNMYEGTQLQRNIERRIREQKDRQILAKASKNNELILKSQKKITELTNKYKKLSDISGLPMKMKRMRVAGYKRTNVKKL